VIPEASRFVYLYLSTGAGKEVPVYVGRGTTNRVADHGTTDSNAELAAIIAGGEYAVEVLDCGDATTATVVEGALISAMLGRSKVDLKNHRLDEFTFSPLGVPVALAARRGMAALAPSEIASRLQGNVLFVRIGPNALTDPSRALIDPGNPSSEAVTDRLMHWWQIAPWVSAWKADPGQEPVALVGIAGLKHRYIIGAVDLSNFDWGTLEWDGRAASFPVVADDASLDGFDLRGRTIRDGAIFGWRSWELARVYDENGPITRPKI
jgi:hypothetical protein